MYNIQYNLKILLWYLKENASESLSTLGEIMYNHRYNKVHGLF